MTDVMEFSEAGRIPMTGDNVAIAIKRLEKGTQIVLQDRACSLSHTVLEGHRFAIEPIEPGAALLSWGLPFGAAIRPVAPGDYICNATILEALAQRNIDFALPREPNFKDHLAPYDLDEKSFRPGRQVARHDKERNFEGFPRSGSRGVGTRNYIVVLATSSLTAGFARALETRLKGLSDDYRNIDGIVAVVHTEGGGSDTPNNLDFLLRTLSGFVVHPNVGAVLAIDYGSEVMTNRMLADFMKSHDYPLEHVVHHFYTVGTDFREALAECEKIVRGWMPEVDRTTRSAQPVSALKIALQCGGSDAFSGVAGNPLAGWVAKEVIRYGGAANLAETDELIGAEEYILSNTRDLPTARKFLEKIAIFKERARWHGHSVEGNPSGGNKFRGLYNIAIKSIGAARKKDPEVCLDYVIDYGERMTAPGYYFMDSPGNDLESIAGQVASGSNVIFFITGNGSITNFPFVPTIKFVTTTGRYDLLSEDMDVNAGRFQDGTPMSELGAETFEYLTRIAAGERSVGERAGHSQVSIWRNWKQTDDSRLNELNGRTPPTGEPIPVMAIPVLQGEPAAASMEAPSIEAIRTDRGWATDQVGLIVPTSLCSAQIARKIADELNGRDFARNRAISRIVALVHTEGCGASGGENEGHFTRTMVGHLLHPFVRKGLLLEHGCEKVHNDAMRHLLDKQGIDDDRFGWASVQMDGGIDSVVRKVEDWFEAQLPNGETRELSQAGLEAFSVGITTVRDLPASVARAFAHLAGTIVGGGGTVVIAENATLLAAADFRDNLVRDGEMVPTLEYGQPFDQPGLHVMAAPTDHAVETLSGMGATGVQAMLAHVTGPPLAAHPMIPLIQITSDARTAKMFGRDLDLVFGEAQDQPAAVAGECLRIALAAATGDYQPRMWAGGNTDFQVTRGLLGLSM